MTSPGGDGSAYVEITSQMDVESLEKFEKDLERALRGIAKRQGKLFGERLGADFLRGFRARLRADLPKYALLGRQAGQAVRRGFNGARFGELAAQDFLRGVRRGLQDADIRVGATAGVSSAVVGGGVSERERLAQLRADLAEQTALQRAALAASNAADRERLLRLRDSLAEESRLRREARADEVRRTRDFNRLVSAAHAEAIRENARLLKETERVEREAQDAADARRERRSAARAAFIPASASGGGGDLFTQRGLLRAGFKSLPLLTPGIGNLFQSLRDATGALFGIFPAITGAAGLFALFQGRNEQLLKVLKPVSTAFDRVRVNLDGIAAAAAQNGFKVLAKDVANLQPGLEAFAKGFGDALGGLSENLAAAGAGDSLSRALRSIGVAFSALASGPGLTGFFRLLLRINEQVSATLPALFLRLQGFLNGLDRRFAETNFGAIFERGVQAVVDFGAALVNLLRVLNAFFAAVSGNREQGTFFANLRRRLADLVVFIRANSSSITDFFDAMRSVLASLGTVIGVVLRVVGAVLAVAAAFITWLDSVNLLTPVVVAFLALLVAGPVIAFATSIGGLILSFLALGAPVLIAVGAIAALVAAFVYANSSSSALADVIRTVLNSALLSVVSPASLALEALSTLLGGVARVVEAASKIPGVGSKFDGLAASVKGAAVATGVLADELRRVVTIDGPGARGTQGRPKDAQGRPIQGPGLSTEDKEVIAAAEKRATDQKKLDNTLKGILDGFKGSFTSLGPRATGDGGAAAVKAAAKANVDLTALQESLINRLRDALKQGGAETEAAFADLRRTIVNALKGTAQEARTPAVLAVLAKLRSDAVAAARSYEQISAAVEVTKDKLSELRAEQNSFRQSVLDTLKASASIATFLAARPGGGLASFTRFLSRDVDKLAKFQTDLASLLKRGLDPALVRDLAAGGLDNAKFAGKLSQATPGQIALINQLQAQVNRLAEGTATLTAATFNAGISKVAATLDLQLAQQKRQERQLNLLAKYIADSISAAVRGKTAPKLPALEHGGLTNGPSLAGEGRHRELVLPIHDRERSDALLAKHYPQDARTYSTSFTINTPPGEDPRAIAAAVDARLARRVR